MMKALRPVTEDCVAAAMEYQLEVYCLRKSQLS